MRFFNQKRNKKFKSEKGLTLIELLVAMSIFIVFMTICTASILNVIRALAKTNTQRTVHQSVRYISETIIREARAANGFVDPAGVRCSSPIMLLMTGGTEINGYGLVTSNSLNTITVAGVAIYSTNQDTRKVYRKKFYLDNDTIKGSIEEADILSTGAAGDRCKLSPTWTLDQSVALNDPNKDTQILAFDLSGSSNSNPLLAGQLPPYLKMDISAKERIGMGAAGAAYQAKMALESSAVPRGY